MADTYTVERRETISAAPAELFTRVGNLERWDDFSPWAELDPDMDKTYTGDPTEVGAKYHWSGNRKVGEGEMTITDTAADERVVIDLRFIKPFRSESETQISLRPTGDATEVTWSMTGEKTFMVKLMGLFGRTMDKMVGPDFEKGLAKLKRISEAG